MNLDWWASKLSCTWPASFSKELSKFPKCRKSCAPVWVHADKIHLLSHYQCSGLYPMLADNIYTHNSIILTNLHSNLLDNTYFDTITRQDCIIPLITQHFGHNLHQAAMFCTFKKKDNFFTIIAPRGNTYGYLLFIVAVSSRIYY